MDRNDEMDQGVKGWIFNTSRKEFWRVASWYEYVDLVQDGAMIYAKIVAKYPDLKTPKDRMNIFKRAFTNHIHDLSKKRTKSVTEILECTLGTQLHEIEADFFTCPDTSVTLAMLPAKLRETIHQLLTDPYVLDTFRWTGKGWETPMEKLARVMGVDPSRDLLDELRTALTTDPETTAVC